MAGKMLMTKPELETVIGRLDTCASNLGSLLVRMDGVMAQLAVNWSGSAQAAYADAYEQIKTRSLLPVKQLLESYPQTLREAETQLNFSDQTNADTIRNQYGGILN